jgi:hypothetical protein
MSPSFTELSQDPNTWPCFHFAELQAKAISRWRMLEAGERSAISSSAAKLN